MGTRLISQTMIPGLILSSWSMISPAALVLPKDQLVLQVCGRFLAEAQPPLEDRPVSEFPQGPMRTR